MPAKHRQVKNRLGLWIPFTTTTGVMMLLCLIGGGLENRWFVLLFSIIWLNHFLLLLLFPRNISDSHAAVAIGGAALLCRIVPLSAGIDAPPVTGRCIAVLFDLGILALVVGLLHQRRLELRWSILYAMNPVTLYTFAGRGDSDATVLFFLLGAIYLYGFRKWHLMFFSAGLSISFGWVSAAAAPFLLCRKNWKHAWIGVLTVLMAWFFYSHTGMKMMPSALLRNSAGLPVEGPVQFLSEIVSSSTGMANAVSCLLLGISLLFGYRYLHPRRNRLHRNDPVSGCFFAMGACLIFSRSVPLGHLSWILPFVALRPSASWILLCLTIGAVFWGVDPDALPGGALWVHLFIWMPFWILFSRDLCVAWHRNRAPVTPLPPTSVSVVIPVINEADRIESCITAAKAHPAVDEIIVVDNGSTDQTVERAEQMGAVAIRLPPGDRNRGRGGQIYQGIQTASKDLVAIVHADTRVNGKIFDTMLALMRKQPMVVGGAAGSVFDADGWRFRMLELANDFRMVCMGISFGDQVQFFRREPVINTDLFPRIPLMEDVEFGIRLHRLGRLAYLFGDAAVSTRKWKRRGMGHALTVIRLFSTYMVQRLWKTPDTHAMYRSYYGKSAGSG